ncbi:MAG TPA: type I-E CRISPR-associated protein Cse2/CasB [Herpetosiphonaceae bacterium]
MSSTTSSSDPIDYFIRRLETLDSGGRARLKRNAGRTLNEARDVYQVFFSILPFGVHERDHNDYFLIATLYAAGTRRDNPRPANPPRSFGASLRRVRQQIQADSDDRQISLDKRIETLLDADREQLDFRLRQLVSLLVAHEVAVDWRRLLRDVLDWDREDRQSVKITWARHYYAPARTATNENSSSTTDSSVAISTQE